MKAIILAAGRGSRMQNLTDDKPKCLVELHGKSLLEMQIDSLKVAGVKEIAIVTGYRRELLQKFGLIEFYNSRWSETNMVSSLETAKSWLQAEDCIVSYSDIFYSSDAISSLMTCKYDLAITYDPNWLSLWTSRFGDPLLDAETFRLSPNKKLLEIGNKPKSTIEIEGQYMGLLKFTPFGWSEVMQIRSKLQPLERDKMHMTGTLQRVIDAKRLDIICVPYSGGWGEVDSPNDLSHYT